MTERGLTEPIFPPSLRRYESKSLKILDTSVAWYQPTTLSELLQLKKDHPQAKLVVGNTEVGIEIKFKAMEYAVLINPTKVVELQEFVVADFEGLSGVKIGAAVTINRLRESIQQLDDTYRPIGKGYCTRGLKAIRHMLTWLASVAT